ncbi:MAG: UDP-N-acetylmuramoyl-L-alanine--D-glutamate ligase [Rhodocyclaceae bacterium]|nr:UDP-N-acetylmuramoyl-L-alanine--D-glutamate ligase [Rhodocyclaceae bacterium]MDZ4215443.1 UDP-N-acetylmuramoyl-L-alanine--D-glutamate ligase [Rhodocyclaceae bacterium]
MNLSGKHVLILGLGESGLASARWCVRNGARVRVADTRAEPPGLSEIRRLASREAVRPEAARRGCADFCTGEFDKQLLDGIDLLVISPGLSPGLMIVIHARAQGIPVVGEIELFAWALRDLSPLTPVLGITGTNGKTTTTTLTGHLIQQSKKRVGVAGNISPAALDALMAALDQRVLPDVWVLELSSFQLETTESLNCAAAAMLNLSDDHLDRYIDLNDYATAKSRVFNGLGTQVLNRDDAYSRRMGVAGRRLISFGLDAPGDTLDFGLRTRKDETWIVQGENFLLPVRDLPIAGLHNAANAMAALALCVAIGFDAKALVPALKSFKGLAHRVEKVAEIGGITYYDDSKGTNVGATVAALEGLGCKSVVILGGDGKGQDFAPLKEAVARHAQGVVLIGRDAPKIRAAIAGSDVPMLDATDMIEAVALATRRAQPGDAVLLSPACASFDMFKNYEHRAAVFRAAVAQLQESGA